MSSDWLHYDGLIVDLDGVVWLGEAGHTRRHHARHDRA
jgi:hypothetical protein